MTEIPKVVATAQKSRLNPEKWVLCVFCPYCQKEHTHGAGVVVKGHDQPIPEMWGHRQSLCFPGGPYQLV